MTPSGPDPRLSLRIVVGIATAGRPDILSLTLRNLGQQTRLPDRVVICPVAPSDVPAFADELVPCPVQVVSAPQGLPKQRNAIVAASPDADLILFIDDDYFLDTRFLAASEALFLAHPDVVLATGYVIEDGIHGPGLQPEYALERLRAHAPDVPHEAALEPYYGVYGCNMVVRMSAARALGATFDEQLPLYAWQEDIDFSRQMAPAGRIVKTATLAGIHLGSKRGRTSGLRLGYSQVANPIYLMRKGTMAVSFGGWMMARNCLANAARSFRPESHIDRWGRCRGNLMALADLVRGRIDPNRVLEL